MNDDLIDAGARGIDGTLIGGLLLVGAGLVLALGPLAVSSVGGSLIYLVALAVAVAAGAWALLSLLRTAEPGDAARPDEGPAARAELERAPDDLAERPEAGPAGPGPAGAGAPPDPSAAGPGTPPARDRPVGGGDPEAPAADKQWGPRAGLGVTVLMVAWVLWLIVRGSSTSLRRALTAFVR